MTWKQLLELDARLSDRMRVAERPGPLRTSAAVLAHSGDSWFWGAGLVILWWLGSSFWKKWAVLLFVGIAVLAVLVMTIKFIVRRHRPDGEWGQIYRSTDPHSFPSGHAARVFLIVVLATGFGPGWLAFILWIWAPLVALARVAMGVHYISDIVAGVILGIALGIFGLQVVGLVLPWLAGMIPITL